MGSKELSIREITDPAEFTKSAKIIRESFKTVAHEFGLTKENAPTHTSFMTVRRLREEKKGEASFFGLFQGERQTGFVMIEKARADFDPTLKLEITPETYWLEKLAVLPTYRHLGAGEKLVGFVAERIRQLGGKKVILGMMDQHKILQRWYQKLGFRVVSTRTYPHLPFTVAFMVKDLSQ